MKRFSKKVFHGAICFLRKKGYVIPRRFTSEQINLFPVTHYFYGRMLGGASITLEFITESKKVSFDYKFFYRGNVKSTFEVYTNGGLTHLIHDSDLADKGKLEFLFDDGQKRIEIYIPNYSEIGIKNWRVDGDYQIVRKKRTKVLFIGDSITQGGGSRRSAQTYVNIVKRAMNYEIVNQGIGGYYCDENILKELPYNPDKIVVAFGTNHYDFEDEINSVMIEKFFKALHERYYGKKCLVVLPPFRGSGDAQKLKSKFKSIKTIFVAMETKYPTIQIVNAYEMIPHLPEYYLEDYIHPNALGMELYGHNLVKAIKKIRF